MTSDEYRLLIPSYLRGDLDPAASLGLEAELDRNLELQVECNELRELWNQMGALAEQSQPSAALRARFYQALHAHEGSGQRPLRTRSLRPAVAGWLRRRWSLPVWTQVAAGGVAPRRAHRVHPVRGRAGPVCGRSVHRAMAVERRAALG